MGLTAVLHVVVESVILVSECLLVSFFRGLHGIIESVAHAITCVSASLAQPASKERESILPS